MSCTDLKGQCACSFSSYTKSLAKQNHNAEQLVLDRHFVVFFFRLGKRGLVVECWTDFNFIIKKKNIP